MLSSTERGANRDPIVDNAILYPKRVTVGVSLCPTAVSSCHITVNGRRSGPRSPRTRSRRRYAPNLSSIP